MKSAKDFRYHASRLVFSVVLILSNGWVYAATDGIQSITTIGPTSETGDGCNSGDAQGCGRNSTRNSVDVGAAPNGIEPSATVGNPINLMSGNKRQSETDLSIPGAKLTFRRVYNSVNEGANIGLGQGWHHSYAVSLFDAGNGVREIVQSNGARLRFTTDGTDANGYALMRGTRPNHGYLIYKDERHLWNLPDGRTLMFNGSFLVHINWPDQSQLKLHYRNKRLSTVRDETGRVLTLEYSAGGSAGKLNVYEANRFGPIAGHISHLVLPDGSKIQYDYDNQRNLTRVRYADGTTTEYHYENEYYPNHLTGMNDRAGVRFATWTYDDSGRAVSSEHADGVEQVSLQFPENIAIANGEVVQTIVTNSLGDQSIFSWQQPNVSAQPQLLSSSGVGCATCPSTGLEYTYDEFGRLVMATNTEQGNAKLRGSTGYRYDDAGRLAEIYHEDTGGERRLIEQITYDGDTSIPTRLSLPSINKGGMKSTEVIFNDQRLPVSVIERGFSPSVARPLNLPLDSSQLALFANDDIDYKPIERTTSLSWSGGKLVRVDGPRSDVEDITSFTYDEQQRLIGIQPPDSPAFNITAHDAMGRVTRVQWGDRTPVEITYDANGYLKESRQAASVVSFSHDAEGRLLSITDQFNRTRKIAYDDAGRRLSVTDDIGHTLFNNYDSESRLNRQEQLHSDGTMVRVLSFLFDNAGDVSRTIDETIGALPNNTQVLDFHTDAATQDRSITDAHSGQSTTLAMDMANRVLRYTDAQQAVTQIKLAEDKLPSLITDASGNSTLSLRDDFGRVVVQASPDSGWVEYAYDEAGNRILSTLADGTQVQFRFDAANRQIERNDGQTVTQWRWNEKSGTLTEASNPSSIDHFEYDNDTRLTKHTRVLDAREFVTAFKYDNLGRLLIKRLPDGQNLRHHYHESGPNRGSLRAITQQTLFGLRENTLLTQIDLEGRDGDLGYLSGNGRHTQQAVDRLGRVTQLEVSGQLSMKYRFDAAGRVVSIDNNGIEQSYNYIAGRLSAASTKQGSFLYQYDAVGNRIGKQVESIDGQVEDIIYDVPDGGAGNRVVGQTDRPSGIDKLTTYNDGGAPEVSGDVSYTYNTLNRPIEVYRQNELLARYEYNAFGERVKKIVYASNGTPRITYFLYDGSTLTAEIDEAGSVESQYVYLEGSRPVALLRDQKAFTIHADHLGTPRLMSDEQGRIVWEADYTPFGKAAIQHEEQKLSLRLAGQYVDDETGTHYNYFRDYDSETGRYLSSDPMGLLAGLNTYAYVGSNPLGGIDPLGLFARNGYVYIPPAVIVAGSPVAIWLSGLATAAVAAGTAAVGTITAPVWITAGVVVGISVVAVGIYYHNGYQGDEAAFANDFGAPPQNDFNDLLNDLAKYDQGLANTISWDGSWDTFLDLQQKLLDAQKRFVDDRDILLGGGGICLTPRDQGLYDQAKGALGAAGLIRQDAQDSIVDLDELAYNDYKANGGTLTRGDWELAGKPANQLVEQFDKLTDNQARTLLRVRLGGIPGDGLLAHHIIPLQARTLFPELMRKAAEGGFDINDILNGIMLTNNDHVGGHPIYNDAVMEQLDLIDLTQTPQQINRALRRAVDILRRAIENGTFGPWG